jgi:hypothetical protein
VPKPSFVEFPPSYHAFIIQLWLANDLGSYGINLIKALQSVVE